MLMAAPTDRFEKLRVLGLFAGMSDDELATIDALVDEIEIGPGEVLSWEDQPDRRSFIVVAGEAEVAREGRPVATIGPGSFIGEIAMLELRPRSATVTSLTPMRLLVISLPDLLPFLYQPRVAVRVLQTVVGRLREAAMLT